MNGRAPKVSVGMPVYNGEKFLHNALTTLLLQDFDDFELIISDNASTDATPDICKAFARTDNRIRYFQNRTNIGLAANHNRTFELSRGRFFKWAAHDDDFPKAMLARFVDVLENAPPSVSVVYSHCEYIDEHGNVEGIDSDDVARNDPRPHRRFAHFLRHIHMYNCSCGLVRSEMLRRTRMHGLFPMSDHVLFAELALLGVLVEIPEPLLRIRRHPGRTFTANKTATALRQVFDPDNRRRAFRGVRTRVNIELVKSAALVPANVQDKILCTAVALGKPHWEAFKAFGGRHRRKLLGIPFPTPGHTTSNLTNR